MHQPLAPSPNRLECALQCSRRRLKVLAMKRTVSSAARSRLPIIPRWDDLQTCMITFMRRTIPLMPLVLMLTALLFCGCARIPSARTVSRLAVVTSNREAERLYHVEPFKQQHGQLRAEGDHLVWDGLTSSGGHDLLAKVTFDKSGSVASVDVRMLARPSHEPPANPDRPEGPDLWQERIPEVMPK